MDTTDISQLKKETVDVQKRVKVEIKNVNVDEEPFSLDQLSSDYLKGCSESADVEQETMQQPKNVCHPKKTHDCMVCDEKCSSYKTLVKHFEHVHEDLDGKKLRCFKCPHCEIASKDHAALITHIRIHTGEKPYQCDICNVRFRQVGHLNIHMRTHTNERPYECTQCTATFSQSGSLKRHLRSHTGEKTHACPQCNMVFAEERNLKRHLMVHSGVKPFACDQCSSKFRQKVDLERHKWSHLEDKKPFKCDVCEMAFSRKNNLRWHKLEHEGHTPHVCDVCNAGFRIETDLKKHKRTHRDAKSYKCEHCNATSSSLPALKRHAAVHTGKNVFSCDVCNSSFTEKSMLTRHRLRHNKSKAFPCTVCTSAFNGKVALERHKFLVHNEGKYVEEENSLDIYDPYHKHQSQSSSLHIPSPMHFLEMNLETNISGNMIKTEDSSSQNNQHESIPSIFVQDGISSSAIEEEHNQLLSSGENQEESGDITDGAARLPNTPQSKNMELAKLWIQLDKDGAAPSKRAFAKEHNIPDSTLTDNINVATGKKIKKKRKSSSSISPREGIPCAGV